MTRQSRKQSAQNQPALRKGWKNGNPEIPSGALDAYAGGHIGKCVECLSDLISVDTAKISEGLLASFPIDQRCSNERFKRMNLVADRTVCDVQLFSRCIDRPKP